jgi:hypothetical protein
MRILPRTLRAAQLIPHHVDLQQAGYPGNGDGLLLNDRDFGELGTS